MTLLTSNSKLLTAAKRLTVLCLLISVLCLPVWAGGFSWTYSLSTGTVTIENTQKRSSWAPVAILFHYTGSVDTTITIKRISDGNEFLLSTVTLTGVQDVTWVPDADYPFSFGDSLVISTTAINGTLELIQRSN